METELKKTKTGEIAVVQVEELRTEACELLGIPEEDYAQYLSKLAGVVRLHLIRGESFYIPAVGLLKPERRWDWEKTSEENSCGDSFRSVVFEPRRSFLESLENLAKW